MVGKRLGRKEYDGAYTESKNIMYAGLIGAVTVSVLLILLSGIYTGLYRVDYSVKEIGKILLIVFAMYAPVKVENMILGGGIIRSGVYTLLTTEEIFRLIVSLIIFRKRKWMISLS